MTIAAVYYAGRIWSQQQKEAELVRARAKEEAEKEHLVSFADFMGMGKMVIPVVILEKRDRFLKVRTPNGQVFEYSGDYTILN